MRPIKRRHSKTVAAGSANSAGGGNCMSDDISLCTLLKHLSAISAQQLVDVDESSAE